MDIWHKLVNYGIVGWKDTDKLVDIAYYFYGVFERENRYATWEEIRDYLERGCTDGRIE